MAPEPQKTQPYLRILEQPKTNALRLKEKIDKVFREKNLISDFDISAREGELEHSRARDPHLRGNHIQESRFATTR